MVVHIHTFLQKVRRTLKSERGEANYFSTVVFIFIAVILLAFIIDLFSVISTKQELDHAADQMVKQIQLSGGINSETDSLFDFLCSEIEGAENITYSIDATYKTPTPSGMSRAIQLGTPFYITIEGEAKLGGLPHHYTAGGADRLPQHQILAALLKFQSTSQYKIYITAKKECAYT